MTQRVFRGARFVIEDDRPVDLVIESGQIADVLDYDQSRVFENAEKVVDVSGFILLPGLTDAHAHLREPGFEWKEDIESGLAAAARGGFSNVMCMANTDPVNDRGAVTTMMLAKARAARPFGPRLFPIGALTVGLKGKELAPMAELAAAGCVAFSNDGMPVADTELFRRAMEYASDLEKIVIDHCEDPYMAPAAGMNEGEVAARLGLRGQPTASEALQAARDILLAEFLDVPVHLAHVSCRQTVELLAAAKKRGVRVTAETCPHYLLFTEDAVLGYNTAAKVNPPLRTRDDQACLLDAIRSGVIDILATDHAPHAAHEKEHPFDEAPCGITGLDTALSATWMLVQEKKLSVADVARLWSHAPAGIFGLPQNRFLPGDPADFILFDETAQWSPTAATMASKGKNTPLYGQTLPGLVRGHYVGGEKVYES